MSNCNGDILGFVIDSTGDLNNTDNSISPVINSINYDKNSTKVLTNALDLADDVIKPRNQTAKKDTSQTNNKNLEKTAKMETRQNQLSESTGKNEKKTINNHDFIRVAKLSTSNNSNFVGGGRIAKMKQQTTLPNRKAVNKSTKNGTLNKENSHFYLKIFFHCQQKRPYILYYDKIDAKSKLFEEINNGKDKENEKNSGNENAKTENNVASSEKCKKDNPKTRDRTMLLLNIPKYMGKVGTKLTFFKCGGIKHVKLIKSKINNTTTEYKDTFPGIILFDTDNGYQSALSSSSKTIKLYQAMPQIAQLQKEWKDLFRIYYEQFSGEFDVSMEKLVAGDRVKKMKSIDENYKIFNPKKLKSDKIIPSRKRKHNQDKQFVSFYKSTKLTQTDDKIKQIKEQFNKNKTKIQENYKNRRFKP